MSGETKPISLFKKSGTGRTSMCKSCDAKRARDRKLALEEMRGSCFTITNLGGIGG